MSKVPGELGLSFFPRVDACHTDEAFFSILHPSCYALQRGGGWATPPRGCASGIGSFCGLT